MLEAMLRAGGLRTVACGNVGLPIVEAVMDPEPYDVLAVELSSFQLHYTSSMRAESAAVLNVAEDHLDWYAGPDVAWPATPPTRAGSTPASSAPASTTSPTRSPSSWSATPTCRRAPARSGSPSARRASACSGWSTTCSPTGPSSRSARPRPPSCARSPTSPASAPHYVANALAAAALARSHGVSTGAVQQALRAFRPDGHRIAEVAVVDGVTWIDDSKATNPHAALASLQGLRPGGVGRRRAGQGCPLRRPGRCGARTAAGRRAPRAGTLP